MPDLSLRRRPERAPLIHTRDLEVARLLLAKIYGDATVDVPRDSHLFEWRASPIDLGPIALFSAAITSSVIVRGEPSGYTVRLGSSSERAASSTETAEISPGRSGAVFSPGARSELSWDGPSRPITLRVDARHLEAQLEALTGVAVRGPIAFALSMSTADGAGIFLERLCQFLVSETGRAGPALCHPLVLASLGEAVTRALLLGQPHDHSHLLERPAPPSSRSVVRLVEEYVEAHAAEQIRTAELTALAGASMASIEAAFRAHRGATPMAFLRKRRLLLARERLLRPDPGETVTDVAHGAGFLRRETFEAAYAAELGESPVETKRRGLLALEAPPPPSRQRVTSIPVPSPSPATVFVVHGDTGLRDRLTRVLQEAGYEVQAFASLRAFLAAARSAVTGCAVLDAHLADLLGLEVTAALRESGWALPVVLTSDGADVRAAVQAMKAGAVDFLVEPIDGATLLAAVDRGLAHDTEGRAARAEEEALAARVGALSPREREVCERVARGMLNKQIAAELGVSESAVRVYRAKGTEKLGVGSAAELARLLERAGPGA